MKTATFSELRNQAKKYFDAVERGESVEIYRHGKPVAILMPARKRSLSRWKTSSPIRIRIPGVSVSDTIIAEREGR